jgi:hypothetical protein
MNGILGVNATDFGLSRDNLRTVYRKIGGAQLLVRNSPDLAALGLQDGVPYVVYRETDDDPQHNPLAQFPESFVRKRASKVPPGAYIHLTNELDPSADLNAWTLNALAVCEELGRKAVVFNYATHKSKAQYALSEAVIRRAIAGGHAMGVHVYESAVDTFDEGAYQWIDLYRQIGGLWLVTEFAYIDNIHIAERGYRVGLEDEAHERFTRLRAARFAALRTPVAHFAYDQWPDTPEGAATGFGWQDNRFVIDMLAEQNEVYTMSPTPLDERQAVVLSASGLNLRPTTSTAQQQLVKIPFNATFTVWLSPVVEANGYQWVNARYGDQQGFVAVTVNGAATYKIKETEPPPEGAVYSENLTDDEIQQLITFHTGIAAVYKALWDRRKVV